MRLHDIKFIAESRGFAARRPGEEFIDPTNRDDVATFTGLTLLPADQPAYQDHERLISAVEDWQSNIEGKIYKLNIPIKSMRAAMIVDMETPRGPEHFVLFTKNLTTLEGKLTHIPAGTIPGHGGYVMNRDISTSERLGLKPPEIIKSAKPMSPGSVIKTLESGRTAANSAALDQMIEYIKALINGAGVPYTIKAGAEYIKAHQKYLGEWASPIALITGQIKQRQQLPKIEEAMLDGASLKSGTIVYNTDVRESLYDSAVKVGKNIVYISSKAKKSGGASASLMSLYEIMEKNTDDFEPGFWNNSKAARFRTIVGMIMSKGAAEGLLNVAEFEKIITGVDSAAIKQSLTTKDKDIKWTKNIADLMADYAAFTSHPQYDPAKHALAAVAKRLIDKLNNEDYTDVVKKILNHANLVQIYFDAVPSGKDLVVKGFDLVWPPQFEGKIKFSSAKSFSATYIKGRLGFKIGADAARPEDPDDSLNVQLRPIDLKRLQRERELAVGKVTKSGERDTRDPNVPDVVALGREKKS